LEFCCSNDILCRGSSREIGWQPNGLTLGNALDALDGEFTGDHWIQLNHYQSLPLTIGLVQLALP
jgi:hypothetical protein